MAALAEPRTRKDQQLEDLHVSQAKLLMEHFQEMTQVRTPQTAEHFHAAITQDLFAATTDDEVYEEDNQ